VPKWLSDSQVSLGRAGSDTSAIVCTDTAITETYDIASRNLVIPYTKDCTTRLPVMYMIALEQEKTTINVISHLL